MTNRHKGSSLDSFLEEEGVLDELKRLVVEGVASPSGPWAGAEETLAEVRERDSQNRNGE